MASGSLGTLPVILVMQSLWLSALKGGSPAGGWGGGAGQGFGRAGCASPRLAERLQMLGMVFVFV
jgi:hypothetical protein